MAVIRCPHCNKPNPDFLDICQYCDEPMKVTAAAADTAEQPAAASAEPIKALAEWDAFEARPAPSQPAADDEALPGWLSALEAESPAIPRAPTSGSPEALPDWLSAIETETDTATVSAAPAEARLPDWLDEDPDAAHLPSAPADAPAPPSADAPANAALPDWLSALQPAESPELAAAPSQPDLPDWLHDDARPEPAPTSSGGSWLSSGEALPDWLSETATPALGASAPSESPASVEPPAASADTGRDTPRVDAPADAPDWLADVTEPGPEGVTAQEPEPTLPAATPDWLQALSPDSERPSIQTLERPSEQWPEPETVLPREGVEPPLDSGSNASRVEDSSLGRSDLERAELPAWLSAMRPVEVQAAASPTGDSDQYEEAVGVLAGMRGVLRAEPSVVLPGKSSGQVHALTVTDSQARAAQVLAAIARAETGAADRKAKRRLQVPAVRWAITLALIAAALVPFVLPGLFVPPTSISRLTEAAVTTVEALNPTGPVLVAIDYEPGQAGELDPAASALLRHLMRQGLPVATVSTNAGGAGLAQRLLSESANGFGLDEYTHFVNLGYIPGGPAGVLAFGTEPRSVFLADFSGSGAVWNSPAVQSVQRLNDFSAVIVISGSPETARAWIEQTQRLLDVNKPFVIATSASADPLLRPYTISAGGPVDGYIAGLGGVAQYEAKAGLTGAGQTRYAQIGALLWVAAAAILIGNVLSVLRHMRLKRQ
jgi:hypothetical protein